MLPGIAPPPLNWESCDSKNTPSSLSNPCQCTWLDSGKIPLPTLPPSVVGLLPPLHSLLVRPPLTAPCRPRGSCFSESRNPKQSRCMSQIFTNLSGANSPALWQKAEDPKLNSSLGLRKDRLRFPPGQLFVFLFVSNDTQVSWMIMLRVKWWFSASFPWYIEGFQRFSNTLVAAILEILNSSANLVTSFELSSNFKYYIQNVFKTIFCIFSIIFNIMEYFQW